MVNKLSIIIIKNNFFKKNKSGALELDELGKLIIGVILFIILIYIVTVVIGGEFTAPKEDIGDLLG